MSHGDRPGQATVGADDALKRLETTVRRASALFRRLKADNERLERRTLALEEELVRARVASRSGASPDAVGVDAGAEQELAELRQQRRDWLKDRRRLAERVEGILDKLEYLQSESSAN